MIGQRLGPYEITAKLGEGGMGEVYRATDSRLKRDVAIKVLPAAFTADKERLARFEREAQLLAQLNHTNIAQIFGLENSGETHALVMELVPGPTLAERLEAGAFSIPESLSFALQIAQALEEAHQKGIVHRDLKPQNIKISSEGKAKVLDFGLAKAMDATPGSASAADLARSPTLMNSPTLTAVHGTQLGMILGTAAYMAPEQARGAAVDKRADIWAFGVLLYEMLTGERLFEGDSVVDTLGAVMRKEIDLGRLPAGTPGAIRQLLRRCLERSPRNRLHDIADARIVLDDVLAGRADESSAPLAPAPPVTRSRSREAVAWSLAALGLLASAAYFWTRASTSPVAARVIRAALALPPGVSIELDGERAGMPALSHDGRRVAFGARQGAGPMRIWVQELATGAARPLPGTEEGYRPFWSPDDRRIGFFTWSHLSTTPADGGAVARLARARDARGGSWSRNGTILFAPHQVGTLLTIPDGGGETRAATAMPVAVQASATHRFPHFLPDGEHFLYLDRSARVGPGRQAGVTVGRLGSLQPLARLLETATNTAYSEGHLLYVRDGALLAQPFDPKARALSGQAQTLVSDLLFNERFTFGTFSTAESGLLAFLTGHQSDRSQLVWRDRAGRRQGELGAPGILSGSGGLALSRDGRWAAVSRIEEGASDADIWIYDLARGTETRLARPADDDYSPAFAADGNSVIFSSRGSLDNKSVLLRRDLATGAETELLALADRSPMPMSLSSDGALLVYDLGDEGKIGEFDVMVRPLGTGGAERVFAGSKADDSSSQLSPDDRWIAWASDESGQYEVYVAPFPGPGARVQVSRAGGVQPRWNPAGGELFFKTPDNTLTGVPVESTTGTFSVGAPVPLFQIVEFLGWTYDVTADGQRFLVREPLTEGEVSPITLVTNWTSLLSRP